MQRRVQDGCRIFLPNEDVVQMFGDKLKLSRITVVPQAHCQLRLILDLSEKLN